MKTIKPRPLSAAEALNSTLPSGSQPLDGGRADQVSARGDKLKDYSIDFEDINQAVIYYFKNVIKPYVIEDGSRVEVPVITANQERWKTAQMDANIRDKDGKILFPVIVLKKDTVEKNRAIGNKLDGNQAHNYYTFQAGYSKESQYSNFSLLTNRRPAKSYNVVVVPDYYKITYSCAVYVNKIGDLDKILEAIMYSSYSYWGDPKRFTFMAMVDSMPITQEMNQGENRKIYSVFNIVLNGHIIPDSINQYMSIDKRMFSKAKVSFQTNVGIDISVGPKSQIAKKTQLTNSGGGGFNSNANTLVIAAYLANNTPLSVASVDIAPPDTFYIRNKSILQAPKGLPATSKSNFFVHVNGRLLQDTDVISITQIGGDIQFVVNTVSIGFTLDNTQTIEVIGKFI